jgi:PAS domain S-box-containing protein
MQDAVVVHRSGTPVMVNDAFTALFGHTRADMRVDGIHVDALFAHAPSHTEPDLQTLPALRADGSTFWCEVQVRQLEIGTETLCVYIMRDITARLLLEAQQLELSVEREKVNVLQQFIGNLSHDFRTPLSVMKTSLYLIDRLREAPEKREAQFGVLREQVAHVQTLLDDLLQMAKLDRGNTSDYRYAWRDVSAIVRALADEQQKELLRKHQHLVLDLADGLPLVLVDENAIGRMLKHLLRNALVYTAEHGTITLRTRMESDAEQRRWAVIDIEDTGTGIDPRDLPYIFDRFYRADAARPTREGGTGVGLTIARRIAEVHEGTITVESRPGVGSVFHVRLPIVHRLAREAAPHTPLASARAETSEVAPQRAGSLSEMPSDAPRTSERSAIA